MGSQSANGADLVYLPFIGWMLAIISTLFSVIAMCLALIQTSRSDGYEKVEMELN